MTRLDFCLVGQHTTWNGVPHMIVHVADETIRTDMTARAFAYIAALADAPSGPSGRPTKRGNISRVELESLRLELPS